MSVHSGVRPRSVHPRKRPLDVLPRSGSSREFIDLLEEEEDAYDRAPVRRARKQARIDLPGARSSARAEVVDLSDSGAGPSGAGSSARAEVVDFSGSGAGPSDAGSWAQPDVVDLEDDDFVRAWANSLGHTCGGGEGWPRPAGEIVCPICMDSCEASGSVELTCGDGRIHCFCQECLTTYVRGKVGEGEVMPEQLGCPFAAPRCAVPLPPHVVLLCLPDEAARSRYSRLTLQRSIELSDDADVCPTAGCPFAFFFDPGQIEFDCPACGKSYCLACRVEPWHQGRTCAQVQAERRHDRADTDDPDMAFARLAAREQLKQCPKCKFWVQKQDGCDAMHCRCGFVFCYRCGGVLKATAAAHAMAECSCGERTHELLRIHENSHVNHNLLPAGPPPAAYAPPWLPPLGGHAARQPPHAPHIQARRCRRCGNNQSALGCVEAACGHCCGRVGCNRHR